MGQWSPENKARHQARLRDSSARRRCPGCGSGAGLVSDGRDGLFCRYCFRRYAGPELPCAPAREVPADPLAPDPRPRNQLDRTTGLGRDPAFVAAYDRALVRFAQEPPCP